MRENHMVFGQAKELFILPRVRDIKELKYKDRYRRDPLSHCNAINRITFRTPSLHSPLAILYYITPTAEKISGLKTKCKMKRCRAMKSNNREVKIRCEE